MQKCKICALTLPFESFYKTDRSKCGYRGVCKLCSSSANKHRYHSARKDISKSPMERLALPDLSILNEIFTYDGNNLLRKKSAGCRKAGSIATRPLTNTGYLCVTVDSVRYLAHRIIWFMCNGDQPAHIDHINRDKADNRIDNLRASSAVNNRSNTAVMNSNTTGLIGVYWYPYKGTPRWRAACGDKHLGYFATKESAARAYNDYVIKRYGEESRVKVEHNMMSINNK